MENFEEKRKSKDKAKTKGVNGTASSFDSLVKDILDNPEKINDASAITDEQVLEIQKRLNPYGYVTGSGTPQDKVRAAASSYTNLREDYIRRFTMTSLVGFIFRMADEWEVPVESRRWVTKAGAQRAKQNESERLEAAPFTPEDILIRAENIRILGQAAKDAAAVSEKAAEIARNAEYTLHIAKASGTKSKAEIGLQEENNKALLLEADKALAKARGLQYAATYELRKFGLEADVRIDATAAIARQHKEVAEVIAKNPIIRQTPGQIEMPSKNAKGIIAEFLRAWFEYNPDAHVRKAYDEFVIRTKTSTIEGLGTVTVDAGDPKRLTLSDVQAKAPEASPTDRKIVEALTCSREVYNSAVCMLRNEQASAALVTALKSPKKFQRLLFPIPLDSKARHSVTTIPPQDTFHRWVYYTEVNFEELRTATEAIYPEKPDLELALILYEYFEGTRTDVDQALAKFRDSHQDEVITDIRGIDFGGWTLMGDFKQNRAKINFYNKHTEVLKRILDRHGEDKKLGKDLMRNRVRQLKAKNIREAGPDAPGLADYRAQNSGTSLSTLGAEKVIGREEMFRLERARGDLKAAKELEVIDQCRETIKAISEAAKVRELTADEERRLGDAQKDLIRAEEMLEVPDNAIQVDVWSHDSKVGTFSKSKFYTKAEAPVLLNAPPKPSEGNPPVAPARTRQTNLAPLEDTTSYVKQEPKIDDDRLAVPGQQTIAPPGQTTSSSSDQTTES